MEYFEKDFGKILKKNALTARRIGNLNHTDCMRVYDRNLEQLNLTVDLYGKWVRITDFGEPFLEEEEKEKVIDICRRMLYIEKEFVIYQSREKRENGQQHEVQDDESLNVVVKENGLLFKVDLKSHVDTGLFLDQEKNRQMIKENSFGKNVLNLFSYTGSFSVYAASGGAKSVTSVDLSSTYSKWSEENLKENGFFGGLYTCKTIDAAVFIEDAITKNIRYDIIIFDPPSFSNSRKMDGVFDVQRDYRNWLVKLYSLLTKSGFILFSTNLVSFNMDNRFKRSLRMKEITSLVRAEGFSKRRNSVRSWILEKDKDEMLTLQWTESEANVNRSKGERSEKSEGTEPKTDGGQKDYRSDSGRSGRSNDSYRRNDSRSRDNGRDRYSRDERPRRSSDRDDRRDRYSRDDRPRKPFDRDDRRDRYSRDDRPRKSFDRDDRRDRYSRDDRPRKSFDRDDRPRKSFDRDDRPRKSFDRDDRPRKSFDRDDRPRKSFDRDDIPRKSFDRDDRSSKSFDKDDSSKKPFGYDTYKPARSRNESSEFFWLDVEKKKEDK